MRWLDIEKKAKGLDIKHPTRYSKTSLIRTIQQAEGYTPCYNTAAVATCNQLNCYWRSDCLKQ